MGHVRARVGRNRVSREARVARHACWKTMHGRGSRDTATRVRADGKQRSKSSWLPCVSTDALAGGCAAAALEIHAGWALFGRAMSALAGGCALAAFEVLSGRACRRTSSASPPRCAAAAFAIPSGWALLGRAVSALAGRPAAAACEVPAGGACCLRAISARAARPAAAA